VASVAHTVADDKVFQRPALHLHVSESMAGLSTRQQQQQQQQ
jgi:hypothetical protein